MGIKRGLKDKLGSHLGQSRDGCWLWLGGLTWNGYARIWHSGKERKAHRVVYGAYCGSIPKGSKIKHTCGVRHCVNPSHLILSSHSS